MKTRRMREVEILGYGFNQKGACGRDGSLSSYDYHFEKYEAAEAKYNAICECGYGSTLWGINSVTLQDEMEINNRNVYDTLRYEYDITIPYFMIEEPEKFKPDFYNSYDMMILKWISIDSDGYLSIRR